jgi:hypothetical protein
MTTDSPIPNPLSTSVGFALGFVGGMALYYLINEKDRLHLKTKLSHFYQEAASGSRETIQSFLDYASAYQPASDILTEYSPRTFEFNHPEIKPVLAYLKDKIFSLLPEKSAPAKALVVKKSPSKKFFSSKHR